MARTDKKVYVLYNEELGYTDACPVFTKKEDASVEAAFKCREHSVQKRNIGDFKPCHPYKGGDKRCLDCAIYFKNLEK